MTTIVLKINPMTKIALEMVYLLERSQTDTSTVVIDLATNKIYIFVYAKYK